MAEDVPILNGSTGIFTAANPEHDGREEEEEAGHGEAHPVHRLVAHDDITVHLVFNSRYGSSSLTKTWYLFERKTTRVKYYNILMFTMSDLNGFFMMVKWYSGHAGLLLSTMDA